MGAHGIISKVLAKFAQVEQFDGNNPSRFVMTSCSRAYTTFLGTVRMMMMMMMMMITMMMRTDSERICIAASISHFGAMAPKGDRARSRSRARAPPARAAEPPAAAAMEAALQRETADASFGV